MHIRISIMLMLGGYNLALNVPLLLFSLGSPAFGSFSCNTIACSTFQNCVCKWELDTETTVLQFLPFCQSVYVQGCGVFLAALHIFMGNF